MGAEEKTQVLIARNEYVYISDNNTGVTRTVVGPRKYTPEAHESVSEKRKFCQLCLGQWVIVSNPARKAGSGRVVTDEQGQVETDVGHLELRIGPAEFPVYPGEEVGEVKEEYVLGSSQAIHLRARSPFVDEGEVKRSPGDEWLVKGPRRYIPTIEVEVVDANVTSVTVSGSQYVVVENPLDPETGLNRLGDRKVVSGPAVFFLEPGEAIERGENGIKLRPKWVLGRGNGLYVQAIRDHEEAASDSSGSVVLREEGTSWLVRGPRTYVPDKDVKILSSAVSLSIGEGEGVYIKDWRTGEVRLESGPQEIMLEPHEKLFEKKLSHIEEITIALGSLSAARLRKDDNYLNTVTGENEVILRSHDWEAIVMRLPDNTIAKINNFKENSFRIAYGPTSTMLGPWEQASILELSAGTPKRPKELYVAAKTLGPDFMSDEIEASTSDHTRLSIKVSYKWKYDVTGHSGDDEIVFATPDPIGFACANLASIIREATAQYRFDEFHRNAGRIIREAVFGLEDGGGAPRQTLVFSENGLKIIAIDLERVEPIDEQIAGDLQAAVKTNINIQLDRAKATAQAEAALSAIENERVKNEAENSMRIEAERARAELILLKAANDRLQAEKEAETKAVLKAKEAEAEAEARARLTEVEINRLKRTAEIVGPEKLAAMETAKAAAARLSDAEKIYVPHDMALHLHE